MAVRIQFRRGTASEWSSTNPILANGEVGFETDTRKFKVGTGDKRWNDPTFPYYSVGTITGVIAGTGLTGGGYSGDVTISLDGTALTYNYMSAKGDLITATGDNSPTLLPVGSTDTEVLQVASSEVTGLKYGKVQTTAIADNAVTEAKILDTSVSTNKLADNAVTAGKLASNAVTGTKIAVNAVTETKIADGSVSTNKLANSAVTTDKIANNAVTGDKFADNTVTTAKIANNTILNEDINEFANIALGKLGAGALPTTITVTTGNYTDRSITVGKLNNTVGVDGVGVWQTWTPTVSGITTNQWTPVYCKYMRLNNTCMVNFVIRLQNLAQDVGGRVLKFTLPITPAFASGLSASEGVVLGSFVHHNVDVIVNGTIGVGVYRAGVVEHWISTYGTTNSFGGPKGLSVSESGDIISFTATYEVA